MKTTATNRVASRWHLWLLCGLLAAQGAIAGSIDINSAGAEELAAELVGVGMGKARAIVKYRREKGGFVAPEELMQVRGIGRSIYESNRKRIQLDKYNSKD